MKGVYEGGDYDGNMYLPIYLSVCVYPSIHVLTRSEKDSNLHLISDKKLADQDEKLLSMNLVPQRRGPGRAGGAHGFANSTHQRVWGFINNFKRDPYTATAGALSKFYDAVCKLVVHD